MAREFKPFELTIEQTQGLEETKEVLDFMEKEIQKAAAAGLDVTQWRQKHSQSKLRVEGLIREYGKK